MKATNNLLYFLFCFTISQGFTHRNFSGNELEESENDNVDVANRIIKGCVASEGQFPYQAALYINMSSHICGGTLISPKHVLTAAHCFHNVTKDHLSVKLGIVSAFGQEGVTRSVSRIIIHPKYDPRYFENDIAVLVLSEFVILTSKINILALPEPSSYTYGECLISGWGRVGRFLPQSLLLLFAHVSKVDHNFCKRFYTTLEMPITDGKLCYGGNGIETCRGDSGGPLTCFTSRKQPILTGITSFGPTDCSLKNFPSVYTNVAKYVHWIGKVTAIDLTADKWWMRASLVEPKTSRI